MKIQQEVLNCKSDNENGNGMTKIKGRAQSFSCYVVDIEIEGINCWEAWFQSRKHGAGTPLSANLCKVGSLF